ncbi:aspartyl-phosphate phosphatase Spo0E family protein [Desulfofundulus salinus]|uniref:Aspartyl-phosphate phosphatase Spo0E family protein n=1 Tax=Desulfofundulus salinus TaxID=2419843 RepID=A0A494WYI7_9FIRM|nr:aspartyl-phosphate phosphatase Spo0E family protein [Desulfofundulus salinum]
MLDLGRVILRLEKARRELLATDPGDKEKLLAASRKLDELIVEYYRAKLGPKMAGSAAGR